MLLWLLSPFGSERSTQSKSILATQFAICQGTSRATASADQWPARIGANPVSGLMGWGFGQTCLWHFMTIIWKVQWTSLSYLYLSLECTACCVSYQSMAVFCQTLSTGIRHYTHRFQGSHKAWDFWLLTDQWYQSISPVYCWSPH